MSFGLPDGWMDDGWMNEWMDGGVNEWMNAFPSNLFSTKQSEDTCTILLAFLDGWMDGWMNG
jgi:hypothetical protein